MRYPPDHKATIKQQILRNAAYRFRTEGIDNVGIANLMTDLNLTHGGFYSHFTGKEALVAAVCRQAMEQMNQQWQDQISSTGPGPETWQQLCRDYLSDQRRSLPDSGCMATSLAGEIARRSHVSRRAFTDSLSHLLTTMQQAQGRDEAEPAMPATAQFALMVGSLLLARTVDDHILSQQFLDDALNVLLG